MRLEKNKQTNKQTNKQIIVFDVRRTHTIRVASFWMLCDFRVWAPSWTGSPLASISCESFESRWLTEVPRVDSLRSGCHEIECIFFRITNLYFQSTYTRFHGNIFYQFNFYYIKLTDRTLACAPYDYGYLQYTFPFIAHMPLIDIPILFFFFWFVFSLFNFHFLA